MLVLEHISKYYGEHIAVKDLSFKVKQGKALGLLGSNGSGKTTTFRLLLGLIEKNEGNIYFDKQPLNYEDKCLFGYLPEEKSMLRDLKVKDQISYLARLKKIDEKLIQERMTYWLDYLHIEQYRNKKVKSLSKGNVQLVQIVCALIHDPQIIIFDEPLNGLDLENVDLFKRLCQKLKDEGKIILISSHQYNNIEDLVDEVVYLYQGTTLFKGNLQQLKKRKKERIITLPLQLFENLEDLNNVNQAERVGNHMILRVKDEKSAYQIIRKCMNEKNASFRCEMVSLQMLIKEALYERTHSLCDS